LISRPSRATNCSRGEPQWLLIFGRLFGKQTCPHSGNDGTAGDMDGDRTIRAWYQRARRKADLTICGLDYEHRPLQSGPGRFLAQPEKFRRNPAQRADFDPSFFYDRLDHGRGHQIAVREAGTMSISACKRGDGTAPMPESVLREVQDFAKLAGGQVQGGDRSLINWG
jgi:hypothetical protein